MASLTVPIDITAINNTANVRKEQIAKLMMVKMDSIFGYLTKIPGVQYTRDLLTFEEGSIMKPYDSTMGTTATLGKVVKRVLTVNPGMFFIQDEMERYRATYMATLEELATVPAKLPFAQWYLETIAEVGMQDLAYIPYRGVKGAGTNAIDITDGFLKIIADEITATNIAAGKGNLYAVTGSAYSTSNIGAELLAQFRKFPDYVQEQGVEIHIPFHLQATYREWLKSEYTFISNGDDVMMQFLDGTNRKAKFIWTSAIPSTSNRVIMAAEKNLCWGVDAGGEFGKIHVFNPNNNPYLMAATGKTTLGFQIRSVEKRMLVVNDLA